MKHFKCATLDTKGILLPMLAAHMVAMSESVTSYNKHHARKKKLKFPELGMENGDSTKKTESFTWNKSDDSQGIPCLVTEKFNPEPSSSVFRTALRKGLLFYITKVIIYNPGRYGTPITLVGKFEDKAWNYRRMFLASPDFPNSFSRIAVAWYFGGIAGVNGEHIVDMMIRR